MSQGEAQETVDKLKVMLWANLNWILQLGTKTTQITFSSSILLFRLDSSFNEIHIREDVRF